MRKSAKKIALSKETLRQLENVQLTRLAGGLAVLGELGDTEDRRCEPSIVSCHAGC